MVISNLIINNKTKNKVYNLNLIKIKRKIKQALYQLTNWL
jgi:hypothetical protein